MWYRLVIVLIGWSSTVTISHTINENHLFTAASLIKKEKLKENNSPTDRTCRLSRYIRDLFVLWTDNWKVIRTYNRVWRAFGRAGLPPKPLKWKRPHKNKELTIFRIEVDKKELLGANHEKLQNILSETTKALERYLWHVGKVQEILGCWNWFFAFSKAGNVRLPIATNYQVAERRS